MQQQQQQPEGQQAAQAQPGRPAQQPVQQPPQRQQPAAAQHPLPFRLLPTRPTEWDPSCATPALNVRLDGCIVPSEASPQGARVAFSHLLVIDDFIGERERVALLDFLSAPGPGDPPASPGGGGRGASTGSGDSVGAAAGGAVAVAEQQVAAAGAPQPAAEPPPQQAGPGPGPGPKPSLLPPSKWERCTTDMAGAAPSWGVRPHVLAELARMELPAMREVHARLAALLPDFDIALLPTEAIQLGGSSTGGGGGGGGMQPVAAGPQQAQPPSSSEQDPSVQPGQQPQPGAGQGPAVDCAAFVANAAVAGDSFAWHVDADPTSFPSPSPWTDAYGDYYNGEPGRPLLASLMVYLNPEWRREWGAETLFLDAATDAGVFVVPRPRRAVLFHQDILHRVSPPAAAAAGRPRFSLVWKLALLPRGRPGSGAAPQLGRPEWGPPAAFGSAARVDAVVRQLSRESRQGREEGERKRQRPAEELQHGE